jgi:hypothetical protein
MGKNNTLRKPKDRAPMYASLWMALFFDLRREFRLARAAR